MSEASAPVSNPACVVNCAVYAPDGVRRDIALDAISDVLAQDDGSFVWIGLYEPDDASLEKLQEEFDLHELAIEDAHNAHQRPKVEAYGQALFLAVNTAQMVDGQLLFGETHIFVGPNYLITVRHGASLSYAHARARVEREPALLALGPSYALYAVLDFIVDNYLPIADQFKATLRALERDIFSDAYRRSTLVRLYDLKRELTEMRMSVAPLIDVLSQLVRSPSPQIPEETRFYFRDVHDHVIRVNDTVDALRDLLGTAMAVNQSLVTLAQGETVRKLGAWAALLAAPTLITSWYGMNFRSMPELDGRYAYPLLVLFVGAVCFGLYRLFRRIGWL
ncbi:magnesium and cobalt transport protein CorA [Luteimonas viscosa]|uniref:Magnesium and cobalt transport protein CorA n=1 Tax=Luteimonas viscosa TaxID=1132694 RepID=A0A5D4XUP4_9GAMM|nr:magnesium and cobalt transport protein CorA [Luteimonas viscosa]TYT27191.1 magnesium and cobalt transport protein CorA [Luteimonas viscosa]